MLSCCGSVYFGSITRQLISSNVLNCSLFIILCIIYSVNFSDINHLNKKKSENVKTVKACEQLYENVKC